MQHCDDDVLALVALGEQPSAADAAHLSGCERCRAEVESFGRVVAAGRPTAGAGPVAPLVEPPARVWDSVAAATGVTVRPRTVDDAGSGRPSTGTPVPGQAPRRPSVSAMRPRRSGAPGRTGWLPLVAVAAAALVVGGVGGSVITRVVTPEKTTVVPIVVAQATLDPLPEDPQARGKALVVRSAGGSKVLEVDVSALKRTDGFYEVWLIDSSVKKMVPVGILTGSRGEFTLPPGLDLGQYPVVDISAEPLDGNPAHSGKSLLRGTIPG